MSMVAVKGMKMPESCSDCDFCHGHLCKRTGADVVANPKDNCPLIEIVTCKDCKHNCKNICGVDGSRVTDNFYCAGGERGE